MVDTFSRRSVLRAGGAAAAVALAGCVREQPNPGHLYAENLGDNVIELAVFWAEQSNGTTSTPEIQSWYRIPEGSALQFEGVLNPEQTYVARAQIRESPERTRTVTVEPCDQNEPAGQRAVAIRAQPGELGIVPYGCSRQFSQRDLEYMNASEYQLESLEENLTTTSSD